MEEFVLVAVASGRELHRKLWREILRNRGRLGVAMEWGHLKLRLDGIQWKLVRLYRNFLSL
jgi:hypothetical protein